MTVAAISTAGYVVTMARAIVAFHAPTPEGFCGGLPAVVGEAGACTVRARALGHGDPRHA